MATDDDPIDPALYRVVHFSGGVGSYAAARRVAARHGTGRLVLIFADTRDEDGDLYRFLVEAAGLIFGVPVGPLVAQARALPETHGSERVSEIAALQAAAAVALPGLAWLADGRDLWTLFRDSRYIANTRADVCSRILKRDVSDAYVRSRFRPDECVLYFGIDGSERHRFEGSPGRSPGLRMRLLPYRAVAPLCDDPPVSKCDLLAECERDGLDPPWLYDEGFPHNNCGGFCVKAGHAQFAHLLKRRPALFAYHADQEAALRADLGKDVTVLRDRRGGVTRPLPMAEFRRQIEAGERAPDRGDWGKGCQCFFPEDVKGMSDRDSGESDEP